MSEPSSTSMRDHVASSSGRRTGSRDALRWLAYLIAGATAAGAGYFAALRPRLSIALTLILVFAVAAAARILRRQVVEAFTRAGVLAVELPVVLLLAGTVVFRIRTATHLAENPIDAAGIFRVLCVGLAALLAIASLLRGDSASSHGRLTTRPVRIYAIYVLIAFVGAFFSVLPFHTLYRGAELLAVLLVVVAGFKRIGADAIPRMEAAIYWFMCALLATAWFGLVLQPERAIFETPDSPLPFVFIGVFPSLSANTIGFLGLLIAFWSIARVLAKDPRRHLSVPLAATITAIGLISMVATQYRTGYAAAVAGLGVLALFRWNRAAALLMIVVGVIVLLQTGFVNSQSAQELLLRGESLESAQALSARVVWWAEAIDVWKQSPAIGKGLLTATRFEALSEGLGRTRASAIHSTWIEALTGTGVIGTFFLASSFLIVWWRALRHGFKERFELPAVLMAILTVRGLTDSTFEIFGPAAVLFLVLAMGLRDAVAPATQESDAHGRRAIEPKQDQSRAASRSFAKR